MGDYSANYNVPQIEFSRGSTGISFKPFLKSFSVHRAVSDDSAQVIQGAGSVRKIPYTATNPDYKLNFSVVAAGIEEAVGNHSKMQKFFRMMYPTYSMKGSKKTTLVDLFVKFGNLINQSSILGAGPKKVVTSHRKESMPGAEDESNNIAKGLNEVLKNTGDAYGAEEDSGGGYETKTQNRASGKIKVLCRNLSYKPDMDMGFFEWKGLILAKSFDISLSFEAMDEKARIYLKNQTCG